MPQTLPVAMLLAVLIVACQRDTLLSPPHQALKGPVLQDTEPMQPQHKQVSDSAAPARQASEDRVQPIQVLAGLNLNPLDVLPLTEIPAGVESLPAELQADLAQVQSEAARVGLAGFETRSAGTEPICGLDCQTELELARHLPLQQQQWLGAHNAYNHKGIFKNQMWDITRQLQAGVRVLELDLHRRPFSSKPRVCHGTGLGDCLLNPFGVRDYQDILNEIKAWSDQHPDQLLMIELENHVKNQAAVEGPLRQIFGSLLYTAAERPLNWAQETPATIVARGKRVIVADFGPHRFDGQLIWDQNLISTNTPSGQFESGCRVSGQPMGERAWGFYDDKVFRKPNPITPANIQTFLNCQVRYLKLDRLSNELLDARHFSWQSANAERACASLGSATPRWQAASCQQQRRFACQNPQGWQISQASAAWEQGPAVCRQEFGAEAAFGVPRNWYQNQQLRQRIPAQSEIWLNFERSDLLLSND